MRLAVKRSAIELIEGDITRQDTDAIVNAANRSLLGGGGVDGAIHRAGGPAILAECRTLGGCATGDAKITTGGNLKARHVIHAVGPVYHEGSPEVARLLASAYRRSLEVAEANGLASVKEYLEGTTGVARVRFVLFGRKDFDVYAKALKELS